MTATHDVADSDLRWYQWHAQYDDLESQHTDRLEVVQELLDHALDDAPAGPLRAVSICAGQARDLLPVLINHPRGMDVSALFVENNPLNASFLHGAIGSTGLTEMKVLVADAGSAELYRAAAPADLLLLGGVFADIDAEDARRTVELLPALCRSGGTVVWSSYGPGLIGADEIVACIETAEWERVALRYGADGEFLVAAHRFTGSPRKLPDDGRLFSFPG